MEIQFRFFYYLNNGNDKYVNMNYVVRSRLEEENQRLLRQNSMWNGQRTIFHIRSIILIVAVFYFVENTVSLSVHTSHVLVPHISYGFGSETK